MRSFALLILPVASLLLGACSMQWPWADEAPSAEATSSISANRLATAQPRLPKIESAESYRLDAGDRVRIVVAGQEGVSGSYDVGENGAIVLPAIGKVPARGLSAAHLSGLIARQLRKKSGGEVHVAVQVETYRPISIYGDVAKPGKYPYVNNMTAETAIEMAGGLKSGGEKSSVTVGSAGQGARPSAPSGPVRPGDTITVIQE